METIVINCDYIKLIAIRRLCNNGDRSTCINSHRSNAPVSVSLFLYLFFIQLQWHGNILSPHVHLTNPSVTGGQHGVVGTPPTH